MREVVVRVSAALAAPPSVARDAWLQHTWKRGGGLPGVVVLPRPEESRLVLPLLLEEQLAEDSREGEESREDADRLEMRYAVTSNGLLSPDLEPPPSHSATVAFEAQPGGGSLLNWDVKFGAQRRPEFYEALTRATVGASVASLVAYCRPRPLRYSLVARLDGCASTEAALDEWLRFVWREGGGLPLPAPLVLSDEPDGRLEILRLPHPLLRERVYSVDRALSTAEYTVSNPSLLTFPVHSHRGSVAFERDAEGVVMRWEVELRPYDRLGWAVRGFTSTVLRTITRNLQSRLAEPDASVPLAGPRGSGPSVGSVSKDTWLGGVLSSHLSDTRPVVEQTLAIFQPWSWAPPPELLKEEWVEEDADWART